MFLTVYGISFNCCAVLPQLPCYNKPRGWQIVFVTMAIPLDSNNKQTALVSSSATPP